ncbi:MAG TPA: DUF6603 domain-containing protein [Longimicrobium sp.]
MSVTDLTALATQLRSLASAHSPVVLDSSILGSATATEIGAAFGLADGAALTVNGIAAGDVPDPTGNQLVVSTGTASVLKKDAVPITLAFSISGGALAVAVTATMPDGWSFGDSFPGLAAFPFDVLTVTSPRFVYASVEQTAFPWPGDAGTTVDLPAGQNFLGQVGLGGFPLVTTLVGSIIGTNSFKIYGPFAPTAGQQLPVGTLTAPLGSGGFSIGSGSNALTLAKPAVAVQIGAVVDDTSPVQDVALLLQGVYQDTLQVSVAIPVTGTSYAISTTPLPNRASINSLIESLPGGAGFTSYIPAELSSVFANVGLDYFTMVVDATPAVTYLGLSISTLQPWTVIDRVLVLEGLQLGIEVVDPAGMNWTRVSMAAQAEFLPKIFTGEFDFEVGLSKNGSWTVDTVSGSYHGAVNLGDIVAGLLGSQDSVPAALRGIAFSNFGVTATRSGGGPFSYTCYGSATAAFPLLDTQLTASLDLVFTKTATSYAVALSGSLVIGEEAFTLDLDLGTAGSQLSATWTALGDPLEFGDIASALGWNGMPAIPGNLDLGLTGAGFSYDFTAGAMVLTARSKNYGQLVFASQLINSQRAYLFDLTVPLNVKLSDIPVAGPQIPPSVDVGIQQLEVAYGSAVFAADAITALNTKLKAIGGTALGYTELDGGMVFVANLQLGSEVQALTLPIGATTPQQQVASGGGTGTQTQPGQSQSQTGTQVTAPATQAPAPTQASGKWFDVGKTFGPLTIGRVGVQYTNGTLIFALDANIALGPIALSLQGLGVGSALDAFSPVFTLSGLGVAYNRPPLEILGAMQRVPASQLAKDVQFQFDGELVVKAEDFSLAALGSYAQLASGMPSLFIFAQLEAPLGGPPAFFVTGLMGGFGFNRSLEIPAQDEVASFPLLLLAAPPPPGQTSPQDPAALLEVLEGTKALNGVSKAWIQPKAGDYWLAAGLEFTSFKLVNTRALLVAEFGQDLNFALLGLSTIQLPLPEVSSTPYAYVELMIRVVVQPSQGVFAATAILSKNSYVLTPDCHLTGGFAFYLWFGDNPNAGQFVVTLGGYHPAFVAPSYFPQVPRLGFNWAVSSTVSIKGTAYFALTSSCAMAGGGLEVLFQDGDLRAWFTAQADFLVSWHPFFYTARIAISIGASYRLNLLVCHKTITVSLGADLSIWGPPTGGIVRIDLVVVSFSVSFGSDGASTATEPLQWSEFTALLPDNASVCTIAITDGLFKTQDGPDNSSGKLWIVRARQLSFQTRSVIPASQLQYGTSTVAKSPTSGAGIGIKPMNLTGVASTHTLSIFQGTSTTPTDTSAWSLQPLPQTMPASLWSAPPVPFSQIPAVPSADVLPGELCGFSVTAPLPEPGVTRGAVSVQLLMEEYLSPPGQAPLAGGVTPTTAFLPTANPLTVGVIAQINAGAAAQGRSSLFAALTGAGVLDGVNGDLTQAAASSGHLFTDPPLQQS